MTNEQRAAYQAQYRATHRAERIAYDAARIFSGEEQRHRAEWRAANREKLREYAKTWRQNRPQYGIEYHAARKIKDRENRIKRRHGITASQYDAMYDRQLGTCAICGNGQHERGKVDLDIDHDHSSNAVRSLLCGPCNRGLGAFFDDPRLLHQAALYLELADSEA